MKTEAQWRERANALDNVQLAKSANVAVNSCKTYTASVRAYEAREEWTLGNLFDFERVAANRPLWFGDSDELKQERELRDAACRQAKVYREVLEERRAADPTMVQTEAEVARELDSRRAEVQRKVDKVKSDWESHYGALGAPLAAMSRSVMGWAESMRESGFRTFGLGKDQPAEERVVGLVRLALLALALYVGWLALSRVGAGAVGVAERGAERGIRGFEMIKDMPVPGV